MEGMYLFYNSNYQTLYSSSQTINFVISNKNNLISQLNFSNNNIRSFVLISLDLCIRLNLIGAIPHIARIISNNDIQLNNRMKAGISFLYPRPSKADDLIGKFDEICTLLQSAIESEEDDNRKSLVTFLSYYSTIIGALHPTRSIIVKNKIHNCLINNQYVFLHDIDGLDDINVNNPETAYNEVQKIIDSINLNIVKTTISHLENYLIEKNTKYADWINSSNTHITFDKIRKFALKHANKNRLKGRGAEIIDSEEDLFTYLKSYGNMHKAKMLSALRKPFPQNFDTDIDIIDWGCGQGLASLIFIEKYRSSRIRQITLIEPSELAIKRAALHCHYFAPNAIIRTICKKLDDIKLDDIKSDEIRTTSNYTITINLFSNILDIDDYSTKNLTSLIDSVQTNDNYFVCVSPHIDDIKTNKIELFEKHFEQRPSFTEIHSKTNTKYNEYWLCNTKYCEESIRHGESQYCNTDYDNNGCLKKWTRVIRVFKT
jgi:hypothetical protein